MNIIIIGIQGSGKGTQAALLHKKYGWPHINLGKLLRDHIIRKTELGLVVKEYIDKGRLVPDDLVIKLIKPVLDAADSGFILDGFPRNLAQERFLLDNYRIDGVVLLDLDDETAVKRISARRHCSVCHTDYNLLINPPKVENTCDLCGGKVVMRDDDHEEAIRMRLNKFHLKTKKVIELFQERGLAIPIQADQPVEVVHQKILAQLNL